MEDKKQQPEQPQQPKEIKITINQEDLEQQRLQREDVDFIGDSQAAMLAKTTPLAKVLLIFLGTFIVVMLVWARWAQVDEVTRG
ncbi:MAG: hypothetical protein KAT71_04295, partial [Gammaproteobacteria bacterium]|nr:hypothetical protein [Gammaproteobacteria bacterium]